jgi:hypothetical protein
MGYSCSSTPSHGMLPYSEFPVFDYTTTSDNAEDHTSSASPFGIVVPFSHNASF